MQPPGRLGGELERDGEADDQPADDEDQEGGRPVADVEAGEIEPAGAALRREAGEAGEQGPAAAARAEAAKGDGAGGHASASRVSVDCTASGPASRIDAQ